METIILSLIFKIEYAISFVIGFFILKKKKYVSNILKIVIIVQSLQKLFCISLLVSKDLKNNSIMFIEKNLSKFSIIKNKMLIFSNI